MFLFLISLRVVHNLKNLINPSHKSQNASVLYHTMQQFVTEMCTCVHIAVTKFCIVGYLSDALWDLWDGSIGNKPELLYIMTWCWKGNKSLTEPMRPSIVLVICINPPSRVEPCSNIVQSTNIFQGISKECNEIDFILFIVTPLGWVKDSFIVYMPHNLEDGYHVF